MATAPAPFDVDFAVDDDPAPTLEDFRINGMREFAGAGSFASSLLEQAHAQLTMLATAYYISDEAPANIDQLHSLNEEIKGRALEGVATLVAFAQFNLEVAGHERRRDAEGR